MVAPVVELALTLLMSLIPTLLFLGLYRGLEAMRDDDLINAWLADPNTRPEETAVFQRSIGLELNQEAMPAADRDAPTAPGMVQCSRCGTANPDHVMFCGHCLQRV